MARLDAYERLVRLDRPIGILLLAWPTLWGLWIARGGVPPPVVLWVFLLGTVLMRSAGCAINDWADRDFDPRVERTKNRPLATGAIRPWEALVVAAVLAAAALALLVAVDAGALALWLSVAAVLLAAVYPFTKRALSVPQAWLGVAFGFGIPLAFAVQTDAVPPVAWALLGANVLWTIAYDTEYAMVDRDDDVKIGIRTSAILFGRHDVAAVMLFHALFIASLLAIGLWQRFGLFYYVGVHAAALLAGWQYFMIRGRSREGCFRAFLHNNWVGAAVFAGIAADRWK
jgi:4-hydroxybenzoate polyprenyltransferase